MVGHHCQVSFYSFLLKEIRRKKNAFLEIKKNTFKEKALHAHLEVFIWSNCIPDSHRINTCLWCIRSKTDKEYFNDKSGKIKIILQSNPKSSGRKKTKTKQQLCWIFKAEPCLSENQINQNLLNILVPNNSSNSVKIKKLIIVREVTTLF